jgi:hypothetical protein
MAGLLAALLMALSLVAARESVAHSLRADRGHDGDACFVCLLAHGKLDQATPALLPVRWAPQALTLLPASRDTGFVSLKLELPPGRGPPVGRCSLPQAES